MQRAEKDFDVETAADTDSDLEVDALAGKSQLDMYASSCKVLGIVPASYFAANVNSKEVRLPHRGLGPKGAQAIAAVLESNTAIAHLDLSDNWIEEGGAHLGRSLQINRTVVFLDLADNRLGHLGGMEIAEMLAFNGTLRTLVLKGNLLGDKEAIHLAEGLKQNNTLQVLNLSTNAIGDLGAISLGAGLATNDSLRDLDLSWNNLRSRGVAGFLLNVKENAVLSTIKLQDNGIGDNAQGVCAYLLKSNSVTALNLSRTRLSDAAIAIISKGIEQNYSIKELNISDNPFGDQGSIALFKAVLSSNCLRKLVLKGIKLSKEQRVKLEELKAEKPEIIVEE